MRPPTRFRNNARCFGSWSSTGRPGPDEAVESPERFRRIGRETILPSLPRAHQERLLRQVDVVDIDSPALAHAPRAASEGGSSRSRATGFGVGTNGFVDTGLRWFSWRFGGFEVIFSSSCELTKRHRLGPFSGDSAISSKLLWTQKTEHQLLFGPSFGKPTPCGPSCSPSSHLDDQVLELDELRKPPPRRRVRNREFFSEITTRIGASFLPEELLRSNAWRTPSRESVGRRFARNRTSPMEVIENRLVSTSIPSTDVGSNVLNTMSVGAGVRSFGAGAPDQAGPR